MSEGQKRSPVVTVLIVVAVVIVLYVVVAVLARINRLADRDPQPNTMEAVASWVS